MFYDIFGSLVVVPWIVRVIDVRAKQLIQSLACISYIKDHLSKQNSSNLPIRVMTYDGLIREK